MTQSDIQNYYQSHWKQAHDAQTSAGDQALAYSSPIEDPVIYPIYERLIQDLNIKTNNANLLDIGSGSGRWVRFFLNRYTPTSITGVDFAESSVLLLNEWASSLDTPSKVTFHAADISNPNLSIPSPDQGFDTINIANVLFHIPEPDKFIQSLTNLRALLNDEGRVVTTEYLPRSSMRTEWMAVRSRYDFEAACTHAGLEIAAIKPCSFFSNDPMGIDGPDNLTRLRFNKVRAMSKQLLESATNDQSKAFITNFLAEIEHATLDYCNERLAPTDLPAQKLVVLRKKQ